MVQGKRLPKYRCCFSCLTLEGGGLTSNLGWSERQLCMKNPAFSLKSGVLGWTSLSCRWLTLASRQQCHQPTVGRIAQGICCCTGHSCIERGRSVHSRISLQSPEVTRVAERKQQPSLASYSAPLRRKEALICV